MDEKLWRVLISIMILNEQLLMFHKHTNEGHPYNSCETIEFCVKSWNQIPIELAKIQVWEVYAYVPQVILRLKLTFVEEWCRAIKKTPNV